MAPGGSGQWGYTWRPLSYPRGLWEGRQKSSESSTQSGLVTKDSPPSRRWQVSCWWLWGPFEGGQKTKGVGENGFAVSWYENVYPPQIADISENKRSSLWSIKKKERQILEAVDHPATSKQPHSFKMYKVLKLHWNFPKFTDEVILNFSRMHQFSSENQNINHNEDKLLIHFENIPNIQKS